MGAAPHLLANGVRTGLCSGLWPGVPRSPGAPALPCWVLRAQGWLGALAAGRPPAVSSMTSAAENAEPGCSQLPRRRPALRRLPLGFPGRRLLLPPQSPHPPSGRWPAGCRGQPRAPGVGLLSQLRRGALGLCSPAAPRGVPSALPPSLGNSKDPAGQGDPARLPGRGPPRPLAQAGQGALSSGDVQTQSPAAGAPRRAARRPVYPGRPPSSQVSGPSLPSSGPPAPADCSPQLSGDPRALDGNPVLAPLPGDLRVPV